MYPRAVAKKPPAPRYDQSQGHKQDMLGMRSVFDYDSPLTKLQATMVLAADGFAYAPDEVKMRKKTVESAARKMAASDSFWNSASIKRWASQCSWKPPVAPMQPSEARKQATQQEPEEEEVYVVKKQTPKPKVSGADAMRDAASQLKRSYTKKRYAFL